MKVNSSLNMTVLTNLAVTKEIKSKRKFCRQYLETFFRLFLDPDPFKPNLFDNFDNSNAFHTTLT